jgi:hypothetical protein
MRITRWLAFVFLAVTAATQSATAQAGYTQITGTVGIVLTHNPQWAGPIDGSLVLFTLTNQPTLTPTVTCPSTTHFAFSSVNVVGKEARDNFINILLLAKATGQTVLIAYNANGTYCDNGFYGVYRIGLV